MPNLHPRLTRLTVAHQFQKDTPDTIATNAERYALLGIVPVFPVEELDFLTIFCLFAHSHMTCPKGLLRGDAQIATNSILQPWENANGAVFCRM